MKNTKVALYLALAAVLCLLGSVSAKADTIDLTWGEQNGTGALPFTLDAGTLNFTIPAGQTIISAVFTSTLGNSTVGSTAVMNVDVNGILVGSCPSTASPCWQASATPSAFSYTFTAADLLTLATGSADLTITQTDCCVIRLGASDLEIITAPITATPEPGTMLLLGVGVLGLAGAKLLKR